MSKMIPLAMLMLFALTAEAQLQKILHQSFELEEINAINLDLHGEYEIEKWAGNTILTETSVQLYDANPNILKFLVKSGRYEIESKGNTGAFNLTSKDKERRSIKTKDGECFEFVNLKIFVPEDFDIVSNKNLKRVIEADTKVDATTTTTKPNEDN